MNVLAFEEAARLYERALSLLESRQGSHASSRSEILLSLATAQYRVGDHAASEATLGRALESARETHNEAVLAEATRLTKRIASSS
jgi:hypothetical protein